MFLNTKALKNEIAAVLRVLKANCSPVMYEVLWILIWQATCLLGGLNISKSSGNWMEVFPKQLAISSFLKKLLFSHLVLSVSFRNSFLERLLLVPNSDRQKVSSSTALCKIFNKYRGEEVVKYVVQGRRMFLKVSGTSSTETSILARCAS